MAAGLLVFFLSDMESGHPRNSRPDAFIFLGIGLFVSLSHGMEAYMQVYWRLRKHVATTGRGAPAKVMNKTITLRGARNKIAIRVLDLGRIEFRHFYCSDAVADQLRIGDTVQVRLIESLFLSLVPPVLIGKAASQNESLPATQETFGQS